MIRQLKVSRDGQELGTWPFDLMFALIRCGSLVPSDTFWIDGMDEYRSLAEIIPPSPSHSKPAKFLGRADDDFAWAFYCRDGSTVIGPRPIDEVMSSILLGRLKEDDLVFIAGEEKWMSVADMVRNLEKESPGTVELLRRIQAVSVEESGQVGSEQTTDDANEWINTAGNIAMISPHIAAGYLGMKGVKKFFGIDPLKVLTNWLNQPPSEPDLAQNEKSVPNKKQQAETETR